MQARLAFPILVKALLVGSILLAGCMGDEVEAPAVEVTLEPPEETLEAGAPATFTVQVKGDPVVPQRMGLAWADSTTDSIARSILVADAFDDLVWSHEQPDANGEMTIELASVPADDWLHIRAMLETEDEVYWSPESKLSVKSPQSPLEATIAVEGAPAKSYVFNRHALRVNVTGVDKNATEVGVAWSTESTLSHDERRLRPTRFDGHQVQEGERLALPGVFRFSSWEIPSADRLYLRGWSVIEGSYYWGNQTSVAVNAPPVYDHLPATANHTVTIEPSSLPIAEFAAFEPQELHLQVGESVQWVNQDEHFHTASHAANESGFHTGRLAGGAESLAYRLLVPGEYEVECRLHPETMRATLIVE